MGDFDNKKIIEWLQELNKRLLISLKEISSMSSIAYLIILFGQYLMYTYYVEDNGSYKTGPGKVSKESIIFSQIAYLRNVLVHLESKEDFTGACKVLQKSLSLYIYGSYEFEDVYIKLLSNVDWDKFIDYCTCKDFSKYSQPAPDSGIDRLMNAASIM